MEKKDTFSKILAILGAALVWLPVLAPVVFGFISLAGDGIFRFDYLLPAELGILVFAGGFLLVWAANRVKLQRQIISWGLGIAAVSIASMFIFGDVEQGSVQWALVVGLLIAYSLAAVVMGVGGALLIRDVFRR